MFKPVEMYKINVVTLRRYRDVLLTYLHEKGVLELKELDTNVDAISEFLGRESPGEAYRKASSYSISISRLADFLDRYRRKLKGGIKAVFFPKERSRRSYRYECPKKLISDVESFLSKVEPEIKEVESRISNLISDIDKIKVAIETLELLSNLDLDVHYMRPTRLLEISVGLVDRHKFEPMVAELKRATNDAVVATVRELEDRILTIVAVLRRDFDRVNPVLAKYSFERIDVPEGRGTPVEVLDDYRSKLAEKEEELEAVEDEARALADRYYEDVIFYKELMENERDKGSALTMLLRTKSTFVLSGWVPSSRLEEVVEGVKRMTEGKAYVEVSKPSEKDTENVPIKLRNPGWLAPFEMITEMYGVPRYDEIDPTPIIAFTYSFFFGFMLTDFFYGLIVAVIAALLVKGHRKLRDGTYRFAYTLLWSSMFTMGMGILFGSYFGNAGDVVVRYLTGNPNFHFPRIADTLRDPIFVLKLALAVGLAHLFTGYTLGFMVKLRNGDKRGAVLDQLSWMLIILGITLLAVKVKMVGEALFGVGILLFAIGEVVNNGGLAGLLIISDFFGFVGSWLSYARLMALALATSGIAMVVNILSKMVWGMGIGPLKIGIIMGIVVFIGGQLFSTAINALGAFVHSLRLQYVEFFGTFYSGEGRPFRPFSSRREVSKVEVSAGSDREGDGVRGNGNEDGMGTRMECPHLQTEVLF